MKLYLINVDSSIRSDHAAVAQRLGPYTSKISMGQSCWVVASGANAYQLHSELSKSVSANCTIVVAVINGNSAWSRCSGTFHHWIQKQLARVTM